MHVLNMLQDFENKEINDIHISITVSLITVRSTLVNINELRLNELSKS